MIAFVIGIARLIRRMTIWYMPSKERLLPFVLLCIPMLCFACYTLCCFSFHFLFRVLVYAFPCLSCAANIITFFVVGPSTIEVYIFIGLPVKPFWSRCFLNQTYFTYNSKGANVFLKMVVLLHVLFYHITCEIANLERVVVIWYEHLVLILHILHTFLTFPVLIYVKYC